MAEALYRKYRPQIFEDVVGQEHIERTLKNAIAQDKVSHAYLFTGPRGTGKTTTARLLAKALLCQRGPTPEPDGTCEDCQLIANGEHPDVYELDAASRTGVENVREEIIGRVQFAPTRGRYKVYIIDEVHMLSTAAFNALLKTLEEPPSHVVMILATTDPQKVPETIHSRCQRFDFRRISAEAIVSRLGAICVSEGVEFEGEALDLIAHRAEGGMRNALTSLEQLIAFGDGKVTLEAAERLLGSIDTNDMAEIVRFVGRRDVAACFRWTADYVETGADLAQFVRDFAEHVRNLYVMSLVGSDVALEVGEAERRELANELPLFGSDRLARLLGVLGDLSAELKTSTNPRLSFEIALTRMVRPESDLTLESLSERIEALENGSAASEVLSAPDAPALASAPPTTSAPVRTPSPIPQPTETASNIPQVSPAASGISEQLMSRLCNPAALQRIWQSVLTEIRKDKAAYGVLFLNTKVAFNEDTNSLVIQFSPENEFAFNTSQKPDVRKSVADAIVRSMGEAVPFVYTQGDACSSSLDSAPEVEAPQVRGVSASESTSTTPSTNTTDPTVSVADPALKSKTGEQSSTFDNNQVSSDDIPPYDDEPVPYEDADAPVSASISSTASSSSTEANEAEDLQTLLAAGFGDGVIVEEVRE